VVASFADAVRRTTPVVAGQAARDDGRPNPTAKPTDCRDDHPFDSE
jgi:hypothetical protein